MTARIPTMTRQPIERPAAQGPDRETAAPARYQPPRVLARVALERVTLFSGNVAPGQGIGRD
jgi:hypothetical protein